MIIYMAVNIKNGKKYIGQTVYDLEKRIRQHLYYAKKGNLPFYRAIKKYSGEGFEWQILYHAKSIEELNAMETYYINAYATHIGKNGYNVLLGGGNRRKPMSVRKKISAAHKGKHTGEKHHMFGKTHSAETRVKMSEASKGAKNHNYGKRFNHNIETKAKISAGMKGNRIGERNHNFGKPMHAEIKAKISAKLKGRKSLNLDLKIYTFFHPKQGIIRCTQRTLINEFGLNQGGVNCLIHGKLNSVKGWRLEHEAIESFSEAYAEFKLEAVE